MDFSNYANYHVWAGDKMREILIDLPDREFIYELDNFFSYKTIRVLIEHMVLALEFSIVLVKQKEPENFNKEVEEIVKLSNDKLLEQWKKTDQMYANLLKGDLSGDITVPNFLGKEFTISKSDFLLQYITHTIFHRGQLVLALKKMGKEFVGTDYLHYLHEIAKK
ncbi:MAG: hypothetical protein FK730_01775 [Asgard group archaeon]|nr:hypothetical protein [Asgard group archaeon]